MKNAEWMVKNNIDFKGIRIDTKIGNHGFDYGISVGKNVHDTMHFRSPRTADQCLEEWLDMEHEEPILDDVEHQYLKGVIRPFRDRAIFVKKTYCNSSIGPCEHIVIRVKSVTHSIADIPFPFFKKGEMYKGMQSEKEYTLEELGLDEN